MDRRTFLATAAALTPATDAGLCVSAEDAGRVAQAAGVGTWCARTWYRLKIRA